MLEMNDLTPVEEHDGLRVKREDLFRREPGINGSKLRMAYHLLEGALESGVTHVYSAQSVLSPQAIMTAAICREFGLKCTLVIGSTPDKAVRNPYIREAVNMGADIHSAPVGYNPVIQREARKLVEAGNLLGSDVCWQMPYGITSPEGSSLAEVEKFVSVGGHQVENLPDDIETLIIPFGSGNTACGILYGLNHIKRPSRLKRVVLVGVGPDKLSWVRSRLKSLGYGIVPSGVELVHITTYPDYAQYSDKMPANLGEIALHPTYEGKVYRFLESRDDPWWHGEERESTLFWIVGGPVL